jgi:hypothetical protein
MGAAAAWSRPPVRGSPERRSPPRRDEPQRARRSCRHQRRGEHEQDPARLPRRGKSGSDGRHGRAHEVDPQQEPLARDQYVSPETTGASTAAGSILCRHEDGDAPRRGRRGRRGLRTRRPHDRVSAERSGPRDLDLAERRASADEGEGREPPPEVEPPHREPRVSTGISLGDPLVLLGNKLVTAGQDGRLRFARRAATRSPPAPPRASAERGPARAPAPVPARSARTRTRRRSRPRARRRQSR